MTAWLDLGLTVNRRQLRMIPSMGDALSDAFDAIVGRGALMCVEPGSTEDDFANRMTGRTGGSLSHGFNDVTMTTVDPNDPIGTIEGLSHLKNSLAGRQHFTGNDRALHIVRLDVPYWSLMEEGLTNADNGQSSEDDAPDAVELWHDCIELMVRCLSASDGDTIVIITPHVLDSRPLPKKLLSLIRIRVAVGDILQPAALALFYDPTKWLEGTSSSRHITGDSIPMQTEWCGRMLSPTRIPEYSLKTGTEQHDADETVPAPQDDVRVQTDESSSSVTDDSNDSSTHTIEATESHDDNTQPENVTDTGDDNADAIIGHEPQALTVSNGNEDTPSAKPSRGLFAMIAGWFRG